MLEALGVTLSKDARARSLQLPAWNEALGLPRPWDQQWSLRIQQVLAFETDLLEYDDIFAGSHVIEAKTAELVEAAQAELDEVLALGGAFEAIDELKGRLVSSNTERTRRIESGEQIVVGVNAYTETAPSPLGGEENIMKVDAGVQDELIADVQAWRSERDNDAVKRSLDELRRVAESGANIMPASIDLAHAGGTTGEWAGPAARGVRRVPGAHRGGRRRRARAACPRRSATPAERVKALPGGPPRFLVAKPGLDGHSNGAEQIAVAARDAGMEVIYQGIRLTPEQIASVARDEDVDVIGLSILSGSHLELVPDVLRLVRDAGSDAPSWWAGSSPRTTDPGFRPWASPPCTPRRTSSWAGSWPTSWTSWSPTAAPDALSEALEPQRVISGSSTWSGRRKPTPKGGSGGRRGHEIAGNQAESGRFRA